MLAYVDGEVAGWLGFGPRPLLPRLARSRTIPTVDDVPVWSILCFNIRVGYRRKGVATALLDGLVDYARRSGHPVSRRTRSTPATSASDPASATSG